jgi:hypothetical protein
VTDRNFARGIPCYVPSKAVMEHQGTFDLIADTNRPDLGKFTVGRYLLDSLNEVVTPNGNYDAVFVVLPNGALVKAAYTRGTYPEAEEFLQVWEDWELEQNGDIYGGFLKQTKEGWEWTGKDIPASFIKTRDIETDLVATTKPTTARKKMPLNRVVKVPEWLEEKERDSSVRRYSKNSYVRAIEERLHGVVINEEPESKTQESQQEKTR